MAKKLGLAMQYPEGYLESQQKTSSCEDEEEEGAVKKVKRGRKRKSSVGELRDQQKRGFCEKL